MHALTSAQKFSLLNFLNPTNLNLEICDQITLDEVTTAIKKLKSGKSAGSDKLTSDHVQHSHSRVHGLTAHLFNAVLSHGYLPVKYMQTLIVLLVKHKKENISDKNN